MKARPAIILVLAVSFVLGGGLSLLLPKTGFSQPPQPPSRVYDEAQTVYLGNLARRQNGVPPLRWNRQLTEAARWFSWDSVENRSEPYCGHQDTQEHWPDWRTQAFGYQGYAGAENAFCGYVTPEQAIAGWMDDGGHQANLLDPNSREIGLGYYVREPDGRSYVAQDFGHDPVYPPLIIENEALATISQAVNLYIYDSESGGGFAGMGPVIQMKVSNDPCLDDAIWEPYTAEKTWSLEPDEGWRTVYVKSRDALSRTIVVSDAIFLGPNLPLDELGPAQMSTTQAQITFYNLGKEGLPFVQFSPGWLADDTFDTFTLWWGNGERVTEASAWGGTAFRLRPGDGESFAWVLTTEFVKDVPLTAYFRLKVSDNTSTKEVARVSVQGGGTEYGPLSLSGTDFTKANHYQEFPLPFIFHSNDTEPFLTFNFWRSGSADVYVDTVLIFTAPEPVTSPLAWTVPEGNYRGQGVWVRYTNAGDQFSSISEANLTPLGLKVWPEALTFLAASAGGSPPPRLLTVQRLGCQIFDWQAQSDAAWLQWQATANTIQLSVDQTGLGVGTYHGTLLVEALDVADVAPVLVPVTLIVAEQLYHTYLPVMVRNR